MTDPEYLTKAAIYLNVCQRTARSSASPVNDPTNIVR